jgi:hypothetical protein
MARQDAEIAADIGDDSTDRPAADLGGDLLRRGQRGKARVGLAVWPDGCRPGLAWCTLCRRARGLGWPLRARRQRHNPGLERVGEEQTAGNSREDQRDIACTEGQRDGGEVGVGGALLEGGGELLAVVDELAHQAEEVGEPAGPIRAGRGGVR